MQQEIRKHIDLLFEKAPKTRATMELKEEMIANAQEKLTDMVSQGYQEADAFEVVINSIGNVEELFAGLEDTGDKFRGPSEQILKLQRKKAWLTTIAVGLYIFAGAMFFFFQMNAMAYRTIGGMDADDIGMVITVLLCIVPTCMLVYASNIIPAYHKKEENMVEDYKQWHSTRQKDKEVRKAVDSIIWSLGLVVYFLVSFTTGAWHLTWIIFLILGCIQSIVSLLFSFGRKD